jgi:hypothetical protein
MNATIIYLRDSDEKAGKVEISVEVIGDPVQSFILADDLMKDLTQANGTYLVRESVFISSPTDQIQ